MSPPDQTNGESGWQKAIYESLHRIAEAAVAREAAGHSLQATMLVHDAWMRLSEQRNIDPAQRTQVLAAGATIIRRLLVDYARRRKAKKRGGPEARGRQLQVDVPDRATGLDVLELHDALNALADQSPRAARVVELKFFGGLSGEEISTELAVSLRTVNNDWKFAKAWLYRSLAENPAAEPGDGE